MHVRHVPQPAAGKPYTRWGNEIIVNDRSVDRCVTTLRSKIESDPHHPACIKTIRDIGYRFAVPFYLFASMYYQGLSFRRRPDRPLGAYCLSRFRRLYGPFIAWSVIYFIARDIKRGSTKGLARRDARRSGPGGPGQPAPQRNETPPGGLVGERSRIRATRQRTCRARSS